MLLRVGMAWRLAPLFLPVVLVIKSKHLLITCVTLNLLRR